MAPRWTTDHCRHYDRLSHCIRTHVFCVTCGLSTAPRTAAGVPYDLSPEFVQELFTKHKIDYIIHGDDPCLLPDGTDAYAHAKKLGRFKMVSMRQNNNPTGLC